MRIPERFILLSQEIKVEFVDDLVQDHQAIGMSKFKENRIILQRPSLSYKITKDQVELTFYHELFHFFFHSIGEEDLNRNEKLVELMGNLLLQFNKTAKSRKTQGLKDESH